MPISKVYVDLSHLDSGPQIDVAKDNVLISEQNETLLIDFGVSRSASQFPGDYDTDIPKGTARWRARELFLAPSDSERSQYVGRCTKATDVWAFGMTVYVRIHLLLIILVGNTDHHIYKELLSHMEPYFDIVNEFQLPGRISSGGLPGQAECFKDNRTPSRFVESSLWSMCLRCWKSEPEFRPTIPVIINELESIRRSHAQDGDGDGGGGDTDDGADGDGDTDDDGDGGSDTDDDVDGGSDADDDADGGSNTGDDADGGGDGDGDGDGNSNSDDNSDGADGDSGPTIAFRNTSTKSLSVVTELLVRFFDEKAGPESVRQDPRGGAYDRYRRIRGGLQRDYHRRRGAGGGEAPSFKYPCRRRDRWGVCRYETGFTFTSLFFADFR